MNEPKLSVDEIDSELLILKTIAESLGEDGRSIENARYGLYRACRDNSIDQARRWSTALRVKLELTAMSHQSREAATAALRRIDLAGKLFADGLLFHYVKSLEEYFRSSRTSSAADIRKLGEEIDRMRRILSPEDIEVLRLVVSARERLP